MNKLRRGIGIGLAYFAAVTCYGQCPGDINGDGVRDNADLAAYVEAYLAGDPATDLTGDAILDGADIMAFVADFLGECHMANWKAQGSSDSGSIAVAAGGTKSYLPERYIAAPSTREVITSAVTMNLYAVGSNASGGEVLAYQNVGTGVFVVSSGGVTDYTTDLNDGDGGAYPTDLKTMIGAAEGGDADTMYDPQAGIVHDGLIVMVCAVHDYNTGTRTVAASWTQQNRVALLYKSIGGGDTWTVVDDDAAQTDSAQTLGAQWMIGRPIIVGSDLLFGWANYQSKAAGNTDNRAYVSKFTKSGSWSHSASVEIFSDATQTAGQHFHTVALHYDANRSGGEKLRAFLFIGDGFDDNGVYECHRADLDIADDAGAKADRVIKDATASASWTRAGFVHGGNTKTNSGTGTYIPHGMQPTYALPLGGRLHVGADESSPAIASFDPTGTGGSDITGVQDEFLPVLGDLGLSGNGWLSLVGDVDDYASPTKGAALVAPSENYTNDGNVTRVAYYNGSGWATIGQESTTNGRGLGMSPDGTVVVGGTGGLVRFTPGTIASYTPLVSSIASTNLVTVAPVLSAIASRVTVSTPTFASEGIDAPPGIDSSVTLCKLAFGAASNAGASFARISMGVADQTSFSGTPTFQARFWIRPIGNIGGSYRFEPKAIGASTNVAGEDLMTTLGGSTTSVYYANTDTKYDGNNWTEHIATCVVTEDITGSYGLMIQFITGVVDSEYPQPDLYFVLEGVYAENAQRVYQRPGLGAPLADTEIVATLPATKFPLTVSGITHPQDATLSEAYIKPDDLLFRLYSAADTYIDFTRDISNSRIAMTYNIAGGGETTVNLQAVEWSRDMPVSIKIEVNGTGLDISASVFGNAYGSTSTIATAATYDWTTVTLDDGSDQGVLMLTEIQAGEVGGQRSRNRLRLR